MIMIMFTCYFCGLVFAGAPNRRPQIISCHLLAEEDSKELLTMANTSASNVNNPSYPQRGYPLGSAQTGGVYPHSAVLVGGSAQRLRGFRDIGVVNPPSACLIDSSFVAATASVEAAYRDLRSIIE